MVKPQDSCKLSAYKRGNSRGSKLCLSSSEKKGILKSKNSSFSALKQIKGRTNSSSSSDCLAQCLGRKIITRSVSRGALQQLQMIRHRLEQQLQQSCNNISSIFKSEPPTIAAIDCSTPIRPSLEVATTPTTTIPPVFANSDTAPKVPRRHSSQCQLVDDSYINDKDQKKSIWGNKHEYQQQQPLQPQGQEHEQQATSALQHQQQQQQQHWPSLQQQTKFDAPPRKTLPSYMRNAAKPERTDSKDPQSYLRPKKNESISTQLCSLAANIRIESSASLAANEFFRTRVGRSTKPDPDDAFHQYLMNIQNHSSDAVSPGWQEANEYMNDNYVSLSEDNYNDNTSISSSTSNLDRADLNHIFPTAPRHPPPFYSFSASGFGAEVVFSGTTQKVKVQSSGVWVDLKGREETWFSIREQDFYLPMCCSYCLTELSCIRDVGYVLCPSCHGMTNTSGRAQNRNEQVVGVGLTLEDLRELELQEPQKKGPGCRAT